MAIKLVNLPPTEFGAKLDFNSNEDLRVVYRPSEQVPDSYEFHDLWYPEQNYPDGYVAVPFESVFDNIKEFPKDTEFVNVVNSTKDPKPINPATEEPYDSWRNLMKHKITNFTTCCAVRNEIYNPTNGNKIGGFSCTNNGKEYYDQDFKKSIWMQGAHVLMNTRVLVTPSVTDYVYILPLCVEHNIHKINASLHPGTGYFMRLERKQKVIRLTGFIPRNTIQDAIMKEELK